MIEPIMYAAIGFLVASLLVIGFIPLVHGRAVRLTMKRLEAMTPLSMSEIQADKDQLRAEFAMSTRRLEMSVEQLKTKTTSQLAEIGKKSEAIGRLKAELGEKTTHLLALEEHDKDGYDQLSNTSQELSSTAAALQQTQQTLKETRAQLEQALAQTRTRFEQQLAGTRAELEKTTANFNEAAVTTDSQRVELVALRAQVEVHRGQIESYDRETRDLQERLTRESAQLAATHQDLAQERGRSDMMSNRIAEVDRLLVAQTTESEILSRRIQEMSTRLADQGRFLAEREYSSDQLRNVASEAQKTEADVRAELAETHNRLRVSTDNLRAEKALVEGQLRLAQDEQEQLQREISAMKRQAESTWASERMENAVLRERINDVAAEVARLTSALEGPNSPIDQILANEARPAPEAPGSTATMASSDKMFPELAPDGERRGTLAERIRALQNRASAVQQAS